MRRCIAGWALALAHGLCGAQAPQPAAPASVAAPATEDISCGPAE